MKKVYEATKNVPKCSLKKGMKFSWDKIEGEYTTEELPWFLTPLISRKEMNYWLKQGLFKEL